MGFGMPKALMFPSPTWYQGSCMKISSDEWIVYGGPNKTFCVLVPTSFRCSEQQKGELSDYSVYCIRKAHPDKITSVDITPDWPLSRNIITGSPDGTVKIWEAKIENNKLIVEPTITHDTHLNAKENVIAVVYSTKQYAMSVSENGNVGKWDVQANHVRLYKKVTLGMKVTCVSASPHKPLQLAIGTKQSVIMILEFTDHQKTIFKVRAYNDDVLSLSWCPQYDVTITKSVASDVKSSQTKTDQNDDKKVVKDQDKDVKNDNPNVSQTSEISDTEVIEEDLFDMYKDHSANEFGHKKYEPEDVVVKVKTDKDENDFLAECNKLKSDILKLNEETTIENLVDALDKASVSNEAVKSPEEAHSPIKDSALEQTESKHQHLLASVSKNGTVQVWSQMGHQLSSCKLKRGSPKQRATNCSALLWYSADVIIVSDTRNYVNKINPTIINEKGNVTFSDLYSTHRRQPYCIVSSSPRVQTSTSTDCPIWSVSQERSMVKYSLNDGRVQQYCTMGGFIYTISPCPYDSSRFAISCGDGALRIGSEEEFMVYWRNLQGTLLTCAWHPTIEGIVAFGTAEARVGVVKAYDTSDRSTRVFESALSSGVYSISWTHNGLYAVAGGRLVLYDYDSGSSKPVNLQIEGREWKISTVLNNNRGLLVTSVEGALALLTQDEPHTLIATAVPFSKLVHYTCWHPEQVSSSNELSPHKDLLAISAHERHIVILELTKQQSGEYKFVHLKRLVGHKNHVFAIQWSPHEEATLLSTSGDHTVRIWSVLDGVCTHVFDVHTESVLSAAWINDPDRSTQIISGGGDYRLLQWDYKHYPVEKYNTEKSAPKSSRSSSKPKTKKRVSGKKLKKQLCENDESTLKGAAKRRLLLPTFYTEAISNNVNGCRKLFNKYLVENGKEVTTEADDKNTRYIKLLGTNNEFEEICDLELQLHEIDKSHDSWLLLSMFRGRVGDALKYALDNNIYSSFLLAISPCVSNKFWMENVRLYVKHIDKMAAENKVNNTFDNRTFGGSVFVSACLHLALHEVDEAVQLLKANRLYPEMVVVLRCRHRMDLLDKALKDWAENTFNEGQYSVAASIYITLKDLPSAVKCLVKSDTLESLRLAADIAQELGEVSCAQYINEDVKRKIAQKEEAQLEELPSLIELLMKEKPVEECDENEPNTADESSDDEGDSSNVED